MVGWRLQREQNRARHFSCFWIIYYRKIMIIIACKRWSDCAPLHTNAHHPWLQSFLDSDVAMSPTMPLSGCGTARTYQKWFLVLLVLNLNYLLIFFSFAFSGAFLFIYLSVVPINFTCSPMRLCCAYASALGNYSMAMCLCIMCVRS